MTEARKLIPEAVDLIASFEGWVDHWYPDPALGWKVPTCCYGHTDAAGEPKYAATKSKTFTVAEGKAILANDLAKVRENMSTMVKVPLTDNQFGALVSLTYNIGEGAFARSTLLKMLNRRDYAGAQDQFKRWNRADGKVSKGLTRRRAAEAAFFAGKPVQPQSAPAGTSAQPDRPSLASAILSVLAAIFNAIVSALGGSKHR